MLSSAGESTMRRISRILLEHLFKTSSRRHIVQRETLMAASAIYKGEHLNILGYGPAVY
jgi:hypothetical protein